jgi:alcohol dehydrogenase (cytochrome c)
MTARRRYLSSLSAVLFALLVAPLLAQQVSFDRLLRADREPQNWLSYSGTIFNQRYSLLTQVTPANVKNLELQWVWQARSLENSRRRRSRWTACCTLQGPPVQGRYQVVALDAVTGRPFWTYSISLPPTRVLAAAASAGDWPSLATRCSWAPSTRG